MSMLVLCLGERRNANNDFKNEENYSKLGLRHSTCNHKGVNHLRSTIQKPIETLISELLLLIFFKLNFK